MELLLFHLLCGGIIIGVTILLFLFFCFLCDFFFQFAASLNLNIHHSGVYNICGSDSDFRIKNLLSFHVICISDLYPSIQTTDDYGFLALRFSYSLDNQFTTVIQIPFSRQLNLQEFYFSFGFAEFFGLNKLIEELQKIMLGSNVVNWEKIYFKRKRNWINYCMR